MKKKNDRIDDLMEALEKRHVRVTLNTKETVEGVIDCYIHRGDSDRFGYSLILFALDDDGGVFYYEDEIADIEPIDG